MSDHHNDQWAQHEIYALRTSHRWATLGILFLSLLALIGLAWLIHYAFGVQGLQVFLIVAGILGIVAFIYLLSIGVSAIYGRQAMQHHDNVLQGLIQFQRADDYGEVARQVASGMSGAIRTGNTADARVLQLVGQITKQQQPQLTDSQQQYPPGWAFDDDDAEVPGTFRRVD